LGEYSDGWQAFLVSEVLHLNNFLVQKFLAREVYFLEEVFLLLKERFSVMYPSFFL
jgi:hypothetical protein